MFEFFRIFKSRHIPRGSFRANVITLFTGTTIAQIIPIALSPILTRLYTPEEFGVFALYLSVVSLVAIVATGRYELAIVLPGNDEDSINILALSIMISFFVSFIALIIVSLYNYQIALLLNNNKITFWLYLVPLSIFLSGLYQTFNYWYNRKKKYKLMAAGKIFLSSFTITATLGFGLGNFREAGLICGAIIGQLAIILFWAWNICKEHNPLMSNISKDRILLNARKYADFLKINSIHALTDVLQSSSVVFLISAFFGSVVLGLYSFAMKILFAPLNLISSSVSQVFYQKASKYHANNDDISFLMKKVILRLSFMSLPIFLCLFFFAPSIFSFIFGVHWREAGIYAQILSPWFFFKFINSSVSHIPIIINKQKEAFFISSIGNFLIIASVLYGCYISKDIKSALYLLSSVLSLFTLLQLIWFIKIAKK